MEKGGVNNVIIYKYKVKSRSVVYIYLTAMSHDIHLDLIPEPVRASVLALVQANHAKEIQIKLLRE